MRIPPRTLVLVLLTYALGVGCLLIAWAMTPTPAPGLPVAPTLAVRR